MDYSKEEYECIKNYIKACLNESVYMCLPLSENPCLPAQGGLVAEYLKENKEVETLVQKIHYPLVQSLIDDERKILKSYGGGCHQKIGVSCISTKFGKITYIRGKSDMGGEISKIEYKLEHTTPPLSLDYCWPLDIKDGLKFTRLSINQNMPNGNIWVSRSNAWLDDWKQIDYNHIIWAAGSKNLV